LKLLTPTTDACRLLQVQARALRSVGAAVQLLIPALQGSAERASALDAFLASVDSASAATEPTEMRAAAVEALQASSLLQVSSACTGELKAPHVHACEALRQIFPAGVLHTKQVW
jgi:hypothetical protein